MAFHRSARSGEDLRRLEKGHGHAEEQFLRSVWWPAFRDFRNLHPEFRVEDFSGRSFYLDFAYICGEMRLALEIDGYGPHVTRLSRWQFTHQLRRQNHLILDGWALLRFSYDEVDEQSRRCQQTLQQFMGRWREDDRLRGLGFLERAVVRLALKSDAPVTPKQVRLHLDVGKRKALKVLRSLVTQGWLEPASGRERIRSYRVSGKRMLG